MGAGHPAHLGKQGQPAGIQPAGIFPADRGQQQGKVLGRFSVTLTQNLPTVALGAAGRATPGSVASGKAEESPFLFVLARRDSWLQEGISQKCVQFLKALLQLFKCFSPASALHR